MTDEVVDRDYRAPDRELRTSSPSTTRRRGRTRSAGPPCADWKGLSKTVWKGDRLRLTGSFHERRYQNKKEEWKTVRTFTVVDLEIEHLSRRNEVA